MLQGKAELWITGGDSKEKSFFGKLIDMIRPTRQQKFKRGDVFISKEGLIIEGNSRMIIRFSEMEKIALGFEDSSRTPKQYRTSPCKPLRIKIG